MIFSTLKYSIVLMLLFSSQLSTAQFDRIYSYTLGDGCHVEVIVKFSRSSNALMAYYLPANLRVALDKKRRQQMSLTKYKAQGKNGGIFHMLLTWGLTKSQLTELQICLDEKFKKPIKLFGSLDMKSASVLRIYGKTPLSTILKRASKSIINVPLNPGMKMAFSAKLSADETKIIEIFMNNSSSFKNDKIEIEFEYSIRSSNTMSNSIEYNKHKLITKLNKLF